MHILKKHKKKIILFLVGLLIIGGISTMLLHNLSANDKPVAKIPSMVEEQVIAEKSFDTTGYTLENPQVLVNPYGNSPLTALILFETKELLAPQITIEGKDQWSTFKNTFTANTQHYLPVYGLYPDKNNIVTIEAGGVTKQVEIETEPLPEKAILPTEVTANKEKLTNDLYFFTPSSEGFTIAYDVNGDVRWYFTQKSLWKIDRLKNGNLLVSTERLINVPYYSTGLYEMDLLGKIYQEYSLEGGYHHDYYEMPNGNLLIASDDFNDTAGTVEDVIVELDRNTGAIVKKIDLKNILNMEDGKSENWIIYDWFHNNSVWYDEATNSITLSGRHQDAVINIDYSTETLNWIIGDPTNWSEEFQKYFFQPIGDFEWQWSQHAAMITPEGYVFILDNGNNKSKNEDEYVPATESYTRGVMYKVDTSAMTIEQIWEYGKERGSAFYSPYISDVDYLSKNHYIVHSGGIVYKDDVVANYPAGIVKADKLVSDTVEILNDEVIFELILPTNNYRVEKMPLYSNTNTLTLKAAKQVGTLGKTQTSKSGFGFMLNAKAIDDNYNKHKLDFVQENDRLAITGQFPKGTTVNIVLYKDMQYQVYEYAIRKRPYTALCVDIFSEEESEEGLTITKYINSDGLSGKYAIYLEIEGQLYNTELYADF